MLVRAVLSAVLSVLVLGVAPAVADEPSQHTVSGQVLDQAGRPVEYADVIVDDSLVATSGPDGRFTTQPLWTGRHTVTVSTYGGRFVNRSPSLVAVDVAHSDVDGVALTVRRNGNIVLRTVDAKGNPLPSAGGTASRGSARYKAAWPNTGYILEWMTPREQRVRESYHVLTNVPDGTYALGGFNFDAFKHEYRLSSPKITVTNGSSALVTVTVTPKSRAVFTGRILTSSGKPLAGALVKPHSYLGREPDDHGNWCRPASTRTDRAGRYRVSCVETARPRLMINDPAWRHAARDVRLRGTLGRTTSVADIRLAAGATVRAKILGPSGKGLPGGPDLRAYIKRDGTFRQLHWALPAVHRTWNRTTYTLKGLPRGTYRFCYAEGDGSRRPNAKHRTRCVKKTYAVRAGTSRTLPTVRLKR